MEPINGLYVTVATTLQATRLPVPTANPGHRG